MNDDRTILSVWMMIHDVSHASPELEEGVGEGVGVARPLGVVEQDYFSLLLILSSLFSCPPALDLLLSSSSSSNFVMFASSLLLFVLQYLSCLSFHHLSSCASHVLITFFCPLKCLISSFLFSYPPLHRGSSSLSIILHF